MQSPFRYLGWTVLVAGLTFSSCSVDSAKKQPEDSVAPVQEQPVVYETFEAFAPLLEPVPGNDTLYVINFWATWCAPCVEEMPYFEQLHEETAGKKIKVLLVSLDFKKDLETKLRPFLQKRQLKPQVIHLADGKYNNWIDRVSPEWSGAIPATLLVKGKQKQFYGEQFPDYTALETWIHSFN